MHLYGVDGVFALGHRVNHFDPLTASLKSLPTFDCVVIASMRTPIPIQAVCAHCGSDWSKQAGADFLILGLSFPHLQIRWAWQWPMWR
jgi:hypothetical protein